MADGSDPRSLRAAVRIIREPAHTHWTPRKRDICWEFGLPAREPARTLVDGLELELRPGSILLVVGPSGSGKSSLLAALAEQFGGALFVGRRRFGRCLSIVDAVAPGRPLSVALEILAACGLGEPRLWLRSYHDLADGEKFRAQLAGAIGRTIPRDPERGLRVAARRLIFCDEFTSVLHRRLARAVAYNLRRLVTRRRLILVAASAREDILEDLQPDQVLRLGAGRWELRQRPVRDRPVSLLRRSTIEPGGLRDYAGFAAMHYRRHDGLGFVDRIFVMRDERREPIGVVVYAHAQLELAPRNLATAGRFVRNVRRLNRELRTLRRLVIHPDLRGCGLGHHLVRQTLPLVGVRFVECLAAMGSIHPVFERAGMRRVGPCPLPRGRMQLLERMRRMKLDPFAPAFADYVARLPRVRRLVHRTIAEWADATHGGLGHQLLRRSSEDLAATFRQIIGPPPVYYLWDRQGEFPRSADAEAKPKTNPGYRPRPARRSDRDRHDPRG